MNRQFLQEVIKNIVAHKLDEAKGKAPVYGYIIADKGTDDPRLQMIGYGNMPKSYWKKKLIKDIEELKKLVDAENWRGAAHVIEKNGVLYSVINMMKEIFEKDLNEQLGTISAAELARDKKAEEEMSPADRKALDAYQNALDRVTDDIRKTDAEISKLQEPVRAKVQRLERKKAITQKKQGQITSKIDALKKKNYE